MPVMLERWNDDKMDGLKAEVDGLGGQMRELRQDIRELQRDMKAGFEQLYRVFVIGVIALTSGVLAGFGGLIALVAVMH